RYDAAMDVAPLINPDILPLLAPFAERRVAVDTLAQLRAQPLVPPPPLSDDVDRVDHAVPGPDGAPDVMVRVHRPKGLEGPLPCVYGIHGGGYEVPAYAAASRATDLVGLPPAYVMVGTADGFHDEDVEYALRLNRAGVPTELHVYAGAPHGFDSLLTGAPVAQRARRAMNEWVERRLHA